MGYRKHLNIIDKQVFDNYFNENKNEECLDFYNIKTKTIELNNELNLNKFIRLRNSIYEEYPDYILKKDNIKDILSFYKKNISDNLENTIRELSNVCNDLLDENTKNQTSSKEQAVKLLQSNLYFFDLMRYYFLEKEIQTHESGLFLLDYFYLLDIYNNFDEQKHIAIITHG